MKTKKQLQKVLWIYLTARDIAFDVTGFDDKGGSFYRDENVWLDADLNIEYGNDGDHEGCDDLIISCDDLKLLDGMKDENDFMLAQSNLVKKIEENLTEILINRYDSF